MPIFLVISRHTPENCPMNNEKVRKAAMNAWSKLEEIAKKYGIKTIWAGSVPNEHLSVYIYDVPSLEAWNKAGMDPNIMAVLSTETAEVKLAMSMEESMKMLRAIK